MTCHESKLKFKLNYFKSEIKGSNKSFYLKGQMRNICYKLLGDMMWLHIVVY